MQWCYTIICLHRSICRHYTAMYTQYYVNIMFILTYKYHYADITIQENQQNISTYPILKFIMSTILCGDITLYRISITSTKCNVDIALRQHHSMTTYGAK